MFKHNSSCLCIETFQKCNSKHATSYVKLLLKAFWYSDFEQGPQGTQPKSQQAGFHRNRTFTFWHYIFGTFFQVFYLPKNCVKRLFDGVCVAFRSHSNKINTSNKAPIKRRKFSQESSLHNPEKEFLRDAILGLSFIVTLNHKLSMT